MITDLNTIVCPMCFEEGLVYTTSLELVGDEIFDEEEVSQKFKRFCPFCDHLDRSLLEECPNCGCIMVNIETL